MTTLIFTNRRSIWFMSILVIGLLIFAYNPRVVQGNQPNEDSSEEYADEDNGDDPNDTPGPTIYGEEIDANGCESEFIVTPPPQCDTKTLKVPAFRGDFCYVVFPGSEWETISPVGKLIEAQKFFEKYCMYFNFTEKSLPPKRADKYRKWYSKWKKAVRKRIIPDKHIKGLRRRLIAQNPGLSPAEIDDLLNKEIERILRNSTIPGKLHGRFYRKMRRLQRDVARKGCKQTLIVFIDEYICYNPKPTRTSACQLKFNQIGITAVDAASKNVLAHEMVHLLGKPTPDSGGKITWEHEKCPNSVLYVTRANWWRPFQFADLLSSAAYQEIITNQNNAPIKLIEKVK